MLSKIRPTKNETFGIFDNVGIRYLTWLRVDLNPLSFYKFKHNFKDTPDSSCKCNHGDEDTPHFLLDCHDYDNIRRNLMRNISSIIESDLNTMSRDEIVNLLIFGSSNYEFVINKQILQETIKFIKNTKRFDIVSDNTV